ncbi:hypothetical protein BGZ92_003896, partial [Podila epicladia]
MKFAIIAVLGTLATASAQAVDCLVTPSDPTCASFVLPDATIKTDLDGLCTQMPFMPGCSLYKSCQGSSKTDQCTKPEICTKAPMIDSFPTTKNASALVIDICTEMDMAGCERCPKPKPGAYAAD